MSADKLLPETVNVCVPDAVPEQLENVEKLPLSVIDGARFSTSLRSLPLKSEDVETL